MEEGEKWVFVVGGNRGEVNWGIVREDMFGDRGCVHELELGMR